MRIITKIKEMKILIKQWKSQGLQVGLVPTMGYLHEGHMSLVKRAVEENDRVVVSIFVNPIQFGINEDLERYPRDLDHDKALCEGAGAEVIFHPEVWEMYPDNFYSYVDMSVITEGLCGGRRPGHFRGVCTVVMKLFHIVNPDKAYFGQKDAQQFAVLKQMVKDFNMEVEMIGLPIVREPDGLAMSSRNKYLSEEERKAALCLWTSLKAAQEQVTQGICQSEEVKKAVKEVLDRQPMAKVDYIEIVDLESMKPVADIKTPVLCAIGVYIGKTRLIDNWILQ